MEDVRDILVSDVVADMYEILTPEQIQELRTSMYARMKFLIITQSDGTLIVRDEETNESLLKRFIATKGIEGCSQNTLRYYYATVKIFIKNYKKDVRLATTADIQIFLGWYYKTRGCSKSNMNNIRRVLSSFYHWMRDNDIIVKSPTDPIKKIKCEQKIRQPFTTEEIELLRLGCRDNIKLRALIEFLLSTACRISEVAALNIADVNFAEGEVVVMGKRSKERKVYLNATAKLYLKKYLDSRIDDSDALFVSDNLPYGRLQMSGMEILIRKLGQKVGVRAYPHKFRHTTATMAIQKGMRVEQVQVMLGHNEIDTTMIYAKVASKDVKYAHAKYLG
ncbi:tyrosine-type recombinase/integrase [Megamonas hypermegale]|uniref:tyrosine-type recombinase/integrase n=1 Tax=Megamonas hypermegale TaxID=158847 RepID=UPI0025A36803|nr:tyrosine-type recombinase/integrase [Megamonas hypermegale]MDM8143181.1 tyrosine-type recombinase/integrase [Megamonas hypermegale]